MIDCKKSDTLESLYICISFVNNGKGIFQNVNGMVSSVMSREEFFGKQGEEFVEEAFRGSLPAFIAAFTTRKKLSEQEIEEILKIIHGKKE